MSAIRSEYMTGQLSGEILETIIDDVVRTIKKSKIDFDAIAFRGVSGALVAPAVAAELHKPLLLVRKNSESSHSLYQVEGCDKYKCRYIIIDDFVCSGSTIKAIVNDINDEFRSEDYRPVGLFLYSPNRNKTARDVRSQLLVEHNFDIPVSFCLPAFVSLQKEILFMWEM